MVDHFLFAQYPQQVTFFEYQRNIGIGHGIAAAFETDNEAMPVVTDIGILERFAKDGRVFVYGDGAGEESRDVILVSVLTQHKFAHGHRFFHQGHTQPLGVDGRIEKFELGIGADHQQRRVSLQDMVSAWHIGNLVGC